MPVNYVEQDDHYALGKDGIYAVFPKGRSAFGPAIHAAAPLADGLNADERTFQPEALATARERRMAPFIGAAGIALSAATAEAREAQAAWKMGITPPPAVADDALHQGREIRDQFRAVDGPRDRHQFIAAASPAALAALLASDGGLAGLTPDELEQVKERALPIFHALRTGAAGSNPKRPSLANGLIVSGVDEVAVGAQAEAAVERFKERMQAVENDEAALRSIVKFIAAVLDIAPEAALERVMEAS